MNLYRRNGDERRRILERNNEDEVLNLVQRLRYGELTIEPLKLAAELGYAPAQNVLKLQGYHFNATKSLRDAIISATQYLRGQLGNTGLVTFSVRICKEILDSVIERLSLTIATPPIHLILISDVKQEVEFFQEKLLLFTDTFLKTGEISVIEGANNPEEGGGNFGNLLVTLGRWGSRLKSRGVSYAFAYYACCSYLTALYHINHLAYDPVNVADSTDAAVHYAIEGLIQEIDPDSAGMGIDLLRIKLAARLLSLPAGRRNPWELSNRLGSGFEGVAYLGPNNTVYKLTNNENEIALAQYLLDNDSSIPILPIIFEVSRDTGDPDWRMGYQREELPDFRGQVLSSEEAEENFDFLLSGISHSIQTPDRAIARFAENKEHLVSNNVSIDPEASQLAEWMMKSLIKLNQETGIIINDIRVDNLGIRNNDQIVIRDFGHGWLPE